MVKYYNLTELPGVLKEITGYKFSQSIIQRYVLKGYLTPSAYVGFGKIKMRLYSEKDVYDFYEKFDDLVKEGKIRRQIPSS